MEASRALAVAGAEAKSAFLLRTADMIEKEAAAILEANAADFCYLAIPEGLMPSDAVLPTWGVVELRNDRTFRVLREPEEQLAVTPEARLALALNVAGAAAPDARFACGIELGRGGVVKLRRPPRRRGRL